jgi:phospholipid/cholesterol/gamma-HCH transport system substrate-binding protein
MKNERKIADTKLGALVIAGLIFLVFSLYMIGKNQNIFGTSMIIRVHMKEVNGLLPGNNVRYKGLNVGTVADIEMINDSIIEVELLVYKSMAKHILKNSLTTVNTDGLMGNKLLQIHPQAGNSTPVEERDIIYPLDQIGREELIDRLSESGDYLEKTLKNLAEVSEKLNQSDAIWATLSDSLLGKEIKTAIRSFTLAGNNASSLAKEGKELLVEIKSGNGLASSLISDSLMVENFQKTLVQMDNTTAEAKQVMGELKSMLESIQDGKGTMGMVYQDSAFRYILMETLINLESSTENFNENMKALRSNFLFRRYFKKKEKAENEGKN